MSTCCKTGCVCAVLSCSVVSDFVTPWMVAHQAPLSLGFTRPEYWSGLLRPLPRGLPHCRWILYHLRHQGSLRILQQVAYPFSRGSS